MPRMVSFFVLIVIVILIGVLFFKVMATFLVPLFLATVIVVVFRPLHRWIAQRCGNHSRLAAGLTTAAITLITLLPTAGVFSLAVIQGSTLLTGLDAGTVKNRLATLRGNLRLEMPWAGELRDAESVLNDLFGGQGSAKRSNEQQQQALQGLLRRVEKLEAELSSGTPHEPTADAKSLLETLRQLERMAPGTLEFEAALQVAVRQFREFKLALFGGPYHAWMIDLANPSDQQIQEWSGQVFGKVQTWLLSVGSATTAFAWNVVLGIFIMLIGTYFFLADGPEMVSAMMRLSPLDDRYEQELLEEFGRISRAVVLATVLSAVAQGLLAGIGYWMVGMDYAILLTLLTIVMAFVPFFGTALVWAPASLWLLFYDERTSAAVCLAIYGATVVSMIDYLVKPAVLKGGSSLHPLLAFLSVLGGVQALGPLGILIGPMAVAFLQTLLNILHRELSAMEQTPTAATK
ncbi:MAG: AI-2E family transporter [Planctomycetota bacterium]|nr:AI-2E family transporter [Planctomycetota bacterium]